MFVFLERVRNELPRCLQDKLDTAFEISTDTEPTSRVQTFI